MTELVNNLFKSRESHFLDFNRCLEKSNELWHSSLRLVITLSSSFLVLTMAMVEKLFPVTQVNPDLPTSLILSWIVLFIAVIFGVIAELNEVIFQGEMAKHNAMHIKSINKKISQGKTEDVYVEDDNTSYMVQGPIIWGAISIDSFLFAIICMCSALLRNTVAINSRVIIFVLAIIFLIVMNVYLINRVKKVK